MKAPPGRNEGAYFDALKRITCYQTVAQLRRHSEDEYGLAFAEALEYAYENVIQEARNAIKGKRSPQRNSTEPPS